MANDTLIKISLLLCIAPLILDANDQISCSKSSTLLETTGDTILTVFVDANYGLYCNITSSKGFQQISTVLHVVQTLNKYDYIPGITLGLRILDTCHNGTAVFRQSLRAAVKQDCAPDYEMGVLMPSRYGPTMNSLHDYGGLSILTYEEQNVTESTIVILAHYLSTLYKVVDLVLAKADSVLDRFLEITRDLGVCVKEHDKRINDKEANVTETVIVAIGEESDIRGWLRQNEKLKSSGKTWLLLPLDNSDVDDVVPAGSYIIKLQTSGFNLNEFSSVDEFLENSEDSANHSPYLLGIGKAIVGLAEVLQDARRRNCSINHDNDDDNDGSCIVSQFRLQWQREIHDSNVYEALRMQARSYTVRYVVAKKIRHTLMDVTRYRIEVPRSRVLPEMMASEMLRLCLKDRIRNCENCTNFQERFGTRLVTKDIVGKNILKNSEYILVLLIAIICGTLVCCIIVAFIVRRFTIDEMLEGNSILTIILILANVFTLLTGLPFCMADDYLGAEILNSRKILLTTLAFAFTFSIMFSRALFLALSIDGIFDIHMDGYLQSFMAFFIFSVQIAMSVMYFYLNTTNSFIIVRSLVFVALLGYNIFLLVAFFVACCFIIRIQRNCNEGKCFFCTAIGLLLVWIVWLICFMVMQPENRDTTVAFGIIGTAYLIILGILIPRVHYMVTHSPRRKNFGRKFDCVDLPINSVGNTIIRQSRSSYDYVHSARENRDLQASSTYPNYYGSPSPSWKCRDRFRSSNYQEKSGYNNCAFKAEMKKIDAAHITLQTCVEQFPRNLEVASNDIICTQPRIYRSERVVLTEKRNRETFCNRNNPSPVRRLHDKMYPMRYSSPANVSREQRIEEEDEEQKEEGEYDIDEEDQGNKDVSRVTRF